MNSLLETFKMRAEAVSAEVHHFAARSEALDFILGFLQTEKVADSPKSYGVWANGTFLDGLDKSKLAAQVPGLRFDVTRDLAADAKVGISQVDWAISDTGTVVQNAAVIEERLVSTLPAIHVVLVPVNGIQPDLAAALAKITPQQSGFISMITGPSRTADIERVLTIGVHGPGRLVVVCVDELGESDERRLQTIN
jgi:L-lactate dehydrogenase complex protein LldG